MEELTYFKVLNKINVNEKTEKKNGLTYLSWAFAWEEVKKIYPTATYNIKRFGENQLPYVFDENTGYMIFTDMTIEGITHEMWLPVMDSANKAMKNKTYTYEVYRYENGKKVWNSQTKSYETTSKEVESATMFDINKTIMRCLVKNIAMFGLGLYIYAGEDLPQPENDSVKEDKTITEKENKDLANKEQLTEITKLAGTRLKAVLEFEKVTLESLTQTKAIEIISKLKDGNK